jgi:hypothetical protein
MENTPPKYPRLAGNYEKPIENRYRESVDQINQIPHRKTLLVHWSGGNLLCYVVNSEGNVEGQGESTITGGSASIRPALQEMANFLKEVSSRVYYDPAVKKSELINLEGSGATLFETVIPDSIREKVKTWPDETWVNISTNEEWIPWELLYDGRGFFGQRFMLFRLPVARQPNGNKPSSEIEQLEPMPLRKIVHAIGGNLSAKQISVSKQLFDKVRVGVEIKLLHEKPLANLIEEIIDADLIHLTCHGHLNPLRLQIFKDNNLSSNLKIDSFGSPNFHIKAGCLVFANACNSAVAELQFGDFLSFGWRFYLKGAAVFIGTLGTIPTEVALTFAEAFYSILARKKDENVWRAFHKAKGMSDEANPAHLLYCFYGNPVEIPTINIR